MRRVFLRMRAASLILPRWLPRMWAGRVRTAMPARPRQVSVTEGEVVTRLCHTLVLVCIMMLINEHLELVEGSTGVLATTVPTEALRGLLRAGNVTQILPPSLVDWTRGDLGWWFGAHDFAGVGTWLAHAGVDGSLLVNLNKDDTPAMMELAELGFGPNNERQRLLGQLRALSEQLLPSDTVFEPTPELPVSMKSTIFRMKIHHFWDENSSFWVFLGLNLGRLLTQGGAQGQLDFWKYR